MPPVHNTKHLSDTPNISIIISGFQHQECIAPFISACYGASLWISKRLLEWLVWDAVIELLKLEVAAYKF